MRVPVGSVDAYLVSTTQRQVVSCLRTILFRFTPCITLSVSEMNSLDCFQRSSKYIPGGGRNYHNPNQPNFRRTTVARRSTPLPAPPATQRQINKCYI